MNYKEKLYKIFPNGILDVYPNEWGMAINCENPKVLAYATTITPDVVRNAAAHKVDLIVSHHAAWGFMYEQKDETNRLLSDLNISNIWCHLPLDKADFGTANSLLSLISATPISAIADGEGRIGVLSHTAPLSEIEYTLDSKLKETPARKHDAGRMVNRVGVVTGAGSRTEYIKECAQYNVDLYLTGETSLYLMEYAKYLRVNVLIYSHNYTEVFGTSNFADKLAKELEISNYGHLDEFHF